MSLLLPVLFCVTLLARVTHAQGGDGFTDENRPYKFGFNIEGYQHRYEEKNEKGIIMGEYGFITGDGIYHLTVYATDENGNFKIVRTKNVYIGLPGEKMSTPVPAVSSLRPERVQEVTEKAPSAPLLGVAGCGGCVIPTTTAPQAEVTGGPSPVRGNAQVGSPLRPIAGSSRDPGNADRRNPQGLNPGGVTTSIPGRPNPNQIVQGPSQLGGGRPQPGNPSILDGGRTKDPNQNISPISGNVAEGGLNDITNDLNDPKIKQMLGGGRPQPGNPSILDGGRTKDPNRNISPISGNIAQGGLNEITNDLNDPKIQQMVAKVPKMTDKITTMDDIEALFYMFNYTLTYHGHNEVGNRGGDKNGSYFFNGRDGFGRNVSYIANEFGYQPNITLYDLSPEETPKEETEKNLTKLLGNEFKWFYGKG